MWCSAGHLLHKGGSVTGKRERESERDLDGEDESLSTSHKLQRQNAGVTSVHASSGNQSSTVNITLLNLWFLNVWRWSEVLNWVCFCFISRRVKIGHINVLSKKIQNKAQSNRTDFLHLSVVLFSSCLREHFI